MSTLTSIEAAELFRTHVIGGPPRLRQPNSAVTIFSWLLADGRMLRLYMTTIPGSGHEHARWRLE